MICLITTEHTHTSKESHAMFCSDRCVSVAMSYLHVEYALKCLGGVKSFIEGFMHIAIHPHLPLLLLTMFQNQTFLIKGENVWSPMHLLHSRGSSKER